jgi:multisubunit Na+/H+ antiporter MnhB subunit
MNPLKPIKNITAAITYPFTMLYVCGLCFFINWFTSPGVWWVQWVVFGMTIGLISVWARALKTIVAIVGVAAIGYFLYRWWNNRKTMNTNDATQTALIEAQALKAV